MTKILVIEDEHVLLLTIQQMLQFEDYEVVIASDGVEGVAMARQHLPDLIVCDIMMPRLDGYGVLQALREDSATRAIPFIFLTAKVERDHQRQGMDLGASDYITKPFTHREFLAAIDTRLGHQRTRQEAQLSELEALRQAVVYALPQELGDLLGGVLDHTTQLLDHAETLSADAVYHAAYHIFEASGTLHRQIENYLLYAQLEILRMAPDRVIVQRNYRLNQPAALVHRAANNVARRRVRADDLTLTLHDASVRITPENLRKITEELVDYVCAGTASGPVEVFTVTEAEHYVVCVTHPQLELAESLIVALESQMPTAQQPQAAGSSLGIIIARRLLDVHDGYLAWHSDPAEGMQWRAYILLHDDECD